MTDYIERKDVAKMIRAHLKATFPKVKFSVRCESYSMGGQINISWTDGPTEKEVNAMVDKYETKGFDGSIDMAYCYDHWLLPDGTVELAGTRGTTGSMGYVEPWEAPKPHPDASRVSLGTGYVNCSRHESDAMIDSVRAAFAQLTESERFDLIHKAEALRSLMPYERPDRYHLDATLADFGDKAGQVFGAMARALAA